MNKKKSSSSMKLFVTNLNSYMASNNLKSISQLATDLKLNYKRVESWVYYNKVPSITTLDYVADRMKVFTHDLIGKEINFSTVKNDIIILNNSPQMFCRNLRKILNAYDIKSADEFSDYFEEKISKHTYYSYFRKNNPKIPSLKTIEQVAESFNLKPYKIIERTDKNV